MEIHSIQREILKELSFADELGFSDFLIKNNIEQDLFNYHLQTLVKLNYVAKDDLKKYTLTTKGKGIIQFMDVTNKMLEMKMPKVAVQMFVMKNNKVLLSKRMRHPFKDHIGFASGKVAWGEDSEQTMKREAFEELDITPIKYNLYAIRRCIDLNSTGTETIHDAIYYVYLITDYTGEVVNTSESENSWYDLKSLKGLQLLPVTKSILEFFQNNKIADPFYETMVTKSLNL